MEMKLPKGSPVHEKLPSSQFKPTAVLRMLRADRHTGYARYELHDFSAVLLFESGKLIGAVAKNGSSRKLSGLDTLTELFDRVIVESGQLDVYALSSDLTYGLNALLDGEAMYTRQELRLLDVRRLFGSLKAQSFNGCVRVYTSDQTSLIFFRNGKVLGYFHDGSSDLETSPEDFQRVAGLGGAMLDVLEMSESGRGGVPDLFEIVNVDALWDAVSRRHADEISARSREMKEKARAALREAATATKAELEALAAARAGKAGRTLIEKELAGLDLEQALKNPNAADTTLGRIEVAARLLIGSNKAAELTATMRSIITGRASKLRPILD